MTLRSVVVVIECLLQYECCGLKDGLDFVDARKWRNVRQIAGDNDTDIDITLPYPLACCKTRGSFPKKIEVKYDTCLTNHTTQNSNFEEVGLCS